MKGLKKLTHHHFKKGEEKVFTTQKIFVNGGEVEIKLPYDELVSTKKFKNM